VPPVTVGTTLDSTTFFALTLWPKVATILPSYRS
jgi:hypothetical protein